MGSLIAGGVPYAAPGLTVTTWLDSPDLWSEACSRPSPRGGKTVRAVIWHSSRGLPADDRGPIALSPGAGPGHDPRSCSYEVWAPDSRCPGAHVVVDHDGQAYQLADLEDTATAWCPGWRGQAVNAALYQGPTGQLYEAQLGAAVVLTDCLTRILGIQRQIPHRYLGPMPRLLEACSDVVGVFGHRDAAKNRGPGDPGSPLFYRLGRAGYEPVDFSLRGDRTIWVGRQRRYGITPDDGVAGRSTVECLRAAGIPHGVWVRRPGD
jgi:hypothetical protein